VTPSNRDELQHWPDDNSGSMKPFYQTSKKNLLLFALVWLGEFSLILLLIKWMFHASPKLFLFLIPWALFGGIMVFRPNCIERMTRLLNPSSDNASKWNPPGFP
jgi:hypothetical protein